MALREVFARFSFAFDGGQKLNQAEKGVDRLAKKASDGGASLAALGTGLIGAFAGNALFAGLNQFASELDVLDDLSAQTKIATDDLQVLGFAAQKSGSSVAEMNSSISLLQKSLGKTTEATGAQVEALTKLKIDTSQPRELAEVLPEIFSEFSKLKTGAEKAQVATSLFGRAGVRLIPTLERGAEGLADLRKELDESGGIVDAETIARAGEYRDNVARLDRSFFALKGTLAGALFPQLSKVLEGISKGVGTLTNFAKGTTLADNAGIALAATLAGPLLGALRPFLGRGLKFAAVFAAVDDLLGFLNGKDSLIADILDGAFGDGTATAVRMWVNDAIGQLQSFIQSSEAAAQAIEDSQRGWVERSLAAFTLLVRDAVAGFPLIRAGFEGTLADMSVALEAFVLGSQNKWNDFIAGLSLPDFVKDALKIDTADAADRLAAAQNRAQAVIEKEGGLRRGSGTSAPGAVRQGRTVSAAEAAQFAAEAGPAENARFGPPVETRGQRIERERAEAQRAAIGLAPAQVQGTLAQAAASGTTAVLNDNKTVNLTFGSGTSAADKEAIKKAVAEALRTDNRAALDALTQRAKK